jgi:Spy/CpxP family protein refolding chaperone
MKARTTLACTLAVMAALLVSSEANAQWGRGWGRGWGGPGPRWGGGYGNGWGRGGGWYGGGWGAWGARGRGCLFGPRMVEMLGLTRAQQDAIDNLHLEALASTKTPVRELDRTESELARLATADEYDEKLALRLRQKARELEGKIDAVWSKYQQQVLALLTPEQRQHYDQLVVARGPYGGPGYGPGYGWGRGRGCYGRGRGWGW